MIARILLVSDGPGAWMAAAAAAGHAAAPLAPAAGMLHVNEVEYCAPPEGTERMRPYPGL